MANQYTCGFCGNIGCKIELQVTSGKGINKTLGLKSDCKFYVKFSLKSAEKCTKNSPCTNRPVKCSICDQVYWSYNMKSHYTYREKAAMRICKFNFATCN